MKFNKLIPELSVKDIEKSKYFYIDVLGFKLEYERIEDKFAFISFEGSQIMLEEINDNWNTGELKYPFGRGVNFQIETSNVEMVRENLVKNNVELFMDIAVNKYKCGDVVYIEKELLVQDVDGYLLRFAEDKVKKIGNLKYKRR